MKRFQAQQANLVFMFILSVFFITGCGNWDGGDGTATPVTPGTSATIIPGQVCPVNAGPTIPTVLSSNPTSGNLNVTTSTTGVAGGGKLITANFSMPMDPLTIESATAPLTFTVSETLTGIPVPGVVTMNALDTIATFTTAAALLPDTQYTVSITTDAESAANLAMACSYEWSFTTVTPAAAGPATVDLGAAEPFGGFGGGAGMTNQGILTVIDGDIGTTAASTLVTGFQDSTADEYTVTPLNDGMVTGRIYTAPPPPVVFGPGGPFGGTAATMAIATAAAGDALIAYNSISPASLPGGIDPGAGQLGGLTLAPGIYAAAGGTFLLTGSDLTLDAQGDTDAVWVFQTAAGLTIGAPGFPRSIILINGAQAKNVFWYVGTAARIEDQCSMVGTIIANSGVTISTAGQLATTTLEGRALSLIASVTVVNTLIYVPAP